MEVGSGHTVEVAQPAAGSAARRPAAAGPEGGRPAQRALCRHLRAAGLSQPAETSSLHIFERRRTVQPSKTNPLTLYDKHSINGPSLHLLTVLLF